MIPQQLLACAAIKIGAYARGLRYLEIQARNDHLMKRKPPSAENSNNIVDISLTDETESNPNINILHNNEEKEEVTSSKQSWHMLMPLMKINDYANGVLPPLTNELVNFMMEIYARLGDADAIQVLYIY